MSLTAHMATTPTITTAPAPTVVRTVTDLRTAVSSLRAHGRRVALVPTMGAFHDGHVSLMHLAAADGYAVVVSLFVNPTQFAPTEDLSAYPRDEVGDVARTVEAGVSCVFAPTVDEIYPDGFATTVGVAGPASVVEGASRPHHFAGVATVVAKLLVACRPDRVVFGQKDAQQVAVIRRVMNDLHLDDIELVVAPIVREADGLAMSSRNAYLSSTERAAATVLRRGLDAAVALAASGTANGREIEAAAHAVMTAEPLCLPEYATLVHPDTFAPITTLADEPALLCVAARVGPSRLIDNTLIPIHGS